MNRRDLIFLSNAHVFEKWVKWEPVKGVIAPVYYGAEIIDRIDILEILLSEAYVAKKTKVIFINSALAYRSTDESHFQETASRVLACNDGPYYGKWAIFKVENSKFIEWLIEESEGAMGFKEAMHFLIRTENSYIEIISTCEPKIEFIG